MSTSAAPDDPAPEALCIAGIAAAEQLVVTTDTLVDAVHFPSDTPAQDVACKALAVNLSDLAAMGANALGVHVTLLRGARSAEWVAAFREELERLSSARHIALALRDAAGSRTVVTVLALGSVPAGEALCRDGAGDGDIVWVSGNLGDAGGALLPGSPPDADHDALTLRLRRPVPRLALGQALRGIASSAIDISDGLTGDSGHLCQQSRLAARVDPACLPIPQALRRRFGDERAVHLALTAGDDYELCFTAPPSRGDAVADAARAAGVPVTPIGHMCHGDDVQIRDARGDWRPAPAAYQHFGNGNG